MPNTVKLFGPYSCVNSINSGISILQGSHHVAQKFTSTTLPFSEARLTSLPSRSFSVSSGSGFASSLDSVFVSEAAVVFGNRVALSAKCAPITITPKIAITMIAVLMKQTEPCGGEEGGSVEG